MYSVNLMKKVENDEKIVGEYDKLWVKKVNKLKNVHKYVHT